MGRKENAPAISLFSFQDIITTITGIMFLVVLLLLLLIFEARDRNATPQERLEQQLNARIAELREQLQKITKTPLSVPQTIPEDLESQLAATAVRLKILQQTQEAIHSRNAIRQTAVREAETQLQAQKKQLELLTDEQKKYEMLAQEAETKRRLIRFVIDTDSEKKPLLVEFGSTGICVLDPTTGKIVDFRRKDSVNFYESIEPFMTWVSNRDPRNEYLTLVLKPVAFAALQLVNDRLRELGFERGVELLPDDEATILPPEEGK